MSAAHPQVTDSWKYNLALWAQRSGIILDNGLPFSFEGHRYLFPLFLDRHQKIVLMKSAQMGATIWMVLRALHQARYPAGWGYKGGMNVGFYFPVGGGVNLLVKSRVEPLMEKCPDLLPYCKEQSRGWKPIGNSALYFFGTGGTTSKDSTPLMSIFFDEVRLMNIKDVEQVKERTSHAPIEYLQAVSTAGYPFGDIHSLFLESDQKWWTTFCQRCGHGFVMAHEFPDCIVDHTIGPKAGQVYYRCTRCKLPLSDTQHGRYIAHGDPNHEVSGYHVSQMISTMKTPQEILAAFRLHENKKEFWNAKLGMPYVDEENKPVSIEMLKNNVNPLLEWGSDFVGMNFMGVDQMSGVNYVIIVTRPVLSEAIQLVHFEIVGGRDPFKRTAQLMEDYNIQICVCDAEPNANDALRFAQWFGKRVFLAKYGMYEDMVRWQDTWRPKPGLKKANPEVYHKYRVFLDKYKSIESTLLKIAAGQIEWPDPEGLIQEAFPLKGGGKQAMPILRTHAYPHFACPVKERIETDPDASVYRWKWNFVGMDPHSLCALDYAVRATERKMAGGFLMGY